MPDISRCPENYANGWREIHHYGATRIVGETKKMKALAINNGKDRTAYTFIEGSKEQGYLACSDFLTGNITEEIKELCKRFRPEEIILQLPPRDWTKEPRKQFKKDSGGTWPQHSVSRDIQ